MALETNRILLRQWKNQDLPAFAKLNSDPEVMKYFPNRLNRKESDAIAEKCKSLISENGWGFWALELKNTEEFLGFVGLHSIKADLPFSPCVEIGWRLSKKHWGNGYATESAKTVLDYAFETLKLNDVVSFTTRSNTPSRAIMERLGFSNTHQNFMHPDIPENSPLAEHVLYKISKTIWQKNTR